MSSTELQITYNLSTNYGKKSIYNFFETGLTS